MNLKGIEPNKMGLATYINSKGYDYKTPKDDYVKIKAYSNSKLNRIAKKLMGFHPQKLPFKAFALGHVIHQQLLEPHLCDLEQYNLTPALLRDVKGMIKSLKRNPLMRYALKHGQKEKVVIWIDEKTGAMCKGKLDLFLPRKIVDIKTTGVWQVESEEAFLKSVFKYGYDRQAAMYMDGSDKPQFQFIAVKKTKPYTVFTITFHRQDPEIKAARKKYQFIINKAIAAGL